MEITPLNIGTPTSHLIFLDTEFTSFESPKLISIGMAASTGENFYAEVPFTKTSASPFVHEVVIPLLHQDSAAYCQFDELHVRILNWLTIVRTGVEIVLCFDSHYDETLFRTIFDGYPPKIVRFRNVDDNINEFLRHEFHVKNMLPEHHALNDAMAMRYAFRERMYKTIYS